MVMEITFDEYDDIVERGKDYPYDMIQITKLENFERLLEEEHGIEFLICLLEHGEFLTIEEQKVKKKLNQFLKEHLQFVEEHTEVMFDEQEEEP